MKILYAGPLEKRHFSWFQEQCLYYDVEWRVLNENGVRLLGNENYINRDYTYGIGYLFPYRIPYQEFEKGKKWLNFHPGPLPEMGGRNLAYNAIMEKRKYFGATIHWMNEKFDEGPIIECQRFEIREHYTAHDLMKISHDILESFFYKYIPMLLRGELEQLLTINEPLEAYYPKEVLNDVLVLDVEMGRRLRALYCPPHYPKVMANRKIFKLVEE
jgi:hypothetical protein